MNPTDEDRVRGLLDDATSGVDPRHGLHELRARTSRPRPRRSWTWAVGGAVVATAATIAVVAVAGGLGRTSGGGSGPAEGVADRSTSSSERSVEAYFVRTTGSGPRLYRDPVTVPAGASALDVATTLAVTGDATDPDYGTGWPAGTRMQRAQLSRGALSVDLSGPVVERPSGMSSAAAQSAVQQLVWTAQSAAGTQTPVTFLVGGRRSDRLLGVDTSRPVDRASATETLAPMSISSPASDGTVGSAFTVTGYAQTYEGTVLWRLTRDGDVVDKGFATAESCCTLAAYSFRVRGVRPGDYTVEVYEQDVSDGEGDAARRAALNTDTKQITVR